MVRERASKKMNSRVEMSWFLSRCWSVVGRGDSNKFSFRSRCSKELAPTRNLGRCSSKRIIFNGRFRRGFRDRSLLGESVPSAEDIATVSEPRDPKNLDIIISVHNVPFGIPNLGHQLCLLGNASQFCSSLSYVDLNVLVTSNTEWSLMFLVLKFA